MKILVCPLNWGLGHATRCIPLIRKLLSEGHEIVIASDGHPMELLKQEFRNLSFIIFPSYNIRYNKGKSQLTAMLRSIPVIISGIIREHHQLKKIIREHLIEQVISDNRFGLWNKHIHSTYITHQLMIKMPKGFGFMTPFIWLGHRFFINRYDACLIPDFKGKENFSGDLSHKYVLPKNASFIGIQSRFAMYLLPDITPVAKHKIYHTVALVSGPEPQRTLFEMQLLDQLQGNHEKTLIVQGFPGKNDIKHTHYLSNNIDLAPHINTPELAAYLIGATRIICRSGYTTIMDLATLDCLHKAEFIPTPGQTEQEYLAGLHRNTKKNRGISSAAPVN